MLSMSHRIKAASSSFPLKFHAHRCPVAKIPSDDTVRRDIDRRFEDEEEYVRDMLQDAPGRLSFAADAWTSPNMHAFLGIVVHWTDAEWQLRNLLMDMPSIDGPHTSDASER